MKTATISKYCKPAVVLLLNVLPVWFLVSLMINGSDTDFIGFGLLMGFFFFLALTIWALVIYFITKPIRRIWLRDLLFYVLLFMFQLSPLLIPGMFVG
jgi:hypothetical protein